MSIEKLRSMNPVANVFATAWEAELQDHARTRRHRDALVDAIGTAMYVLVNLKGETPEDQIKIAKLEDLLYTARCLETEKEDA